MEMINIIETTKKLIVLHHIVSIYQAYITELLEANAVEV
jgi:hypothetical protein